MSIRLSIFWRVRQIWRNVFVQDTKCVDKIMFLRIIVYNRTKMQYLPRKETDVMLEISSKTNLLEKKSYK